MVVPIIRGPQYRPKNSIVLITGTPKMVPRILGNPHLGLRAGLSGLFWGLGVLGFFCLWKLPMWLWQSGGYPVRAPEIHREHIGFPKP